jgi:hypothetical protein
MGLSSEHIPFSRSLRERVNASYSADDIPASGNPLSAGELTAYLARTREATSSPLDAISELYARDGRDFALTPKDRAVLGWLRQAFSSWEEQYPLEAPLRDQVRRLLPLAVAVALRDENFFLPGAHALHQLLDALQAGAVGWQVRLDRAGQMLEQRIERSVEKALEWFGSDRVDFALIARELIAANERDAARAQRMVQRLQEAEEARLRTASARREAAAFINEGLKTFELPSAIGEFLTGPWYDSAQLVLVKYTEHSPEWEQMQRATRQLMESVQDIDPDDPIATDRRSQLLRHLPGELRRWLVSLEQDSDAVDGAVGLVEYAHLRIQHGQQLQRSRIAPIRLPEQAGVTDDAPTQKFANGEWYRFEDEGGELRARLVLQLEEGRHLLFANFVGLKALDLPLRTFAQRLEDGFARHLPNEHSFSLSLAHAAGIDSEDAYRFFVDPSYRPAHRGREEAAPQAETVPPERAPAPPAAPEATTPGQPTGAPHEDPVLRPPPGAETEQPAPAPAPRATPQSTPPPTPNPASPAETPAGPAPAAAPQAYPQGTPQPAPTSAPPAPAQPAPAPAPQVPPQSAPPPAPTPAPATAPPPPPPPPVAGGGTREVDVPMGAWLGFHDGETPIMAKLAVYDPRRDNYIFVNRKGIALRELNRAELLALMDQGLVDILETRSYFREEVERARGENK